MNAGQVGTEADDPVGRQAAATSVLLLQEITTKPTGTGLGLAIVHTVVEDHGGTVGLRVASRGGTTFTVELPLIATRPVAPVPDRPQNAGVPRPRLLS